jgi:chemotaxis protein methyltransferase CheR
MAMPISAELTDTEFQTISRFIESHVGIKMPPTKRAMMQSRLINRLRKLHMSSFKEYIDYVFSGDYKSEELVLMIDALTTNKTEFFREADHFMYLSDKVIPSYISKGVNSLKIWSAGCSSGEEPYTLCIVLKEFMRKNPNTLSTFNITATDISTKVLDKAISAIYNMESVEDISLDIKRSYFLKGGTKDSPVVRVKSELRKYVNFMRLNFMDSDYGLRDMFHIIFCRNVLIYFDKKTQEDVIRKFLRNLEVGGYLFLGHSETILNMDLPLKTVAPTVYQKI